MTLMDTTTDLYQRTRYRNPGRKSCAVLGCKNKGRAFVSWLKGQCSIHESSRDIYMCDCIPPFLLYTFPKDPKVKAAWAKQLKRAVSVTDPTPWQPNYTSRVCSKHFINGQPTPAFPLPILHLAGPEKETEKEKGYKYYKVPLAEDDNDEELEVPDTNVIDLVLNHDYNSMMIEGEDNEDSHCQNCNTLRVKVNRQQILIKQLIHELQANKHETAERESKNSTLKVHQFVQTAESVSVNQQEYEPIEVDLVDLIVNEKEPYTEIVDSDKSRYFSITDMIQPYEQKWKELVERKKQECPQKQITNPHTSKNSNTSKVLSTSKDLSENKDSSTSKGPSKSKDSSTSKLRQLKCSQKQMANPSTSTLRQLLQGEIVEPIGQICEHNQAKKVGQLSENQAHSKEILDHNRLLVQERAKKENNPSKTHQGKQKKTSNPKIIRTPRKKKAADPTERMIKKQKQISNPKIIRAQRQTKTVDPTKQKIKRQKQMERKVQMKGSRQKEQGIEDTNQQTIDESTWIMEEIMDYDPSNILLDDLPNVLFASLS